MGILWEYYGILMDFATKMGDVEKYGGFQPIMGVIPPNHSSQTMT